MTSSIEQKNYIKSNNTNHNSSQNRALHGNSQNHHHEIVTKVECLPESIEQAFIMTYRSVGLGLYGAAMRFAGMPLEKIALFMNSAQVSGTGRQQLRQAIHLTFQDASANTASAATSTASGSWLAPYKVVGPASGVAWFLQYSVMGMVFQIVDTALSNALGVPAMPYGKQLMEDPSQDYTDATNSNSNSASANQSDSITAMKLTSKLILAPILAGTVESIVANRAEVQRYFGLQKFAHIESSLKSNPIKRICGPAFLANSSRNCIMSATSFVITPVLYRQYFPQELKSQSSLFWAGLGINIFLGNTVAITQQALWGRALDYVAHSSSSAVNGGIVARNVHYSSVIKHGLAEEGISAFFTVPKWATRVMMNAPVQGTLPWFYNDVLPLAEGQIMSFVNDVYCAYANGNEGTSSTNGRRKEQSSHVLCAEESTSAGTS